MRRSERLNKGQPPAYLGDYTTSTPMRSLLTDVTLPNESAITNQTVIDHTADDLLQMDDPAELMTTIMPNVNNPALPTATESTELCQMMRKVLNMVERQEKQIVQLQTSVVQLQDERQPKVVRFDTPPRPNKCDITELQNTNQSHTQKEQISTSQMNVVDAAPLQTRREPFLPQKILDLPPFGGEPENWPGFIASFDETSKAFGYTDLVNMYRLQKSLSGKAKEAVAGMLIYPENVENVLNELEFRFGRPEILLRSQVAKIREVNCILDDDVAQLIQYSTTVKNMTALFQAAQMEPHLRNPGLLEELVSKLSMHRKLEWARYMDALALFPTIMDFNKWLDSVARLASLVDPAATAYVMSRKKSRNDGRDKRVLTITNSDDTASASNTQLEDAVRDDSSVNVPARLLCPICKTQHTLVNCATFQQMSLAARMENLRKFGVCFRCLVRGHIGRNCFKRDKCGVDGCDRFHHPLLHEVTQIGVPSLIGIHQQRDDDEMVLFKVIPVRLFGRNNKLVETFALLDDGSFTTIIDESLAKQLELEGPSETLKMRWYDNRQTEELVSVVSVGIQGMNEQGKRYELRGARTVRNLKLPKQSLRTAEIEMYPQLKGLPIARYQEAEPKLLIGLNNARLIKTVRTVDVNDKAPLAAKTPLGWFLYGPCNQREKTVTMLFTSPVNDDDSAQELNEIDATVKEYFEQETVGVRPDIEVLKSKDDIRAERLMKENTIKKDGRYETGLLWREDNMQLPESFPMAERRLRNLIKKLSRDNLMERYQNGIDDFCTKGYARRLSDDEIMSNHPRLWYLPHFAVLNQHKPDKLRIVHDAAAKVNLKSLNDHLLAGPDLTTPMLRILLQFREGKFVVVGDLKEMFNQIRMRPDDRSSLRFIWRRHADAALEHYEMLVLIFGAVCSPSLAQYCKNVNAELFDDLFPDAAQAIRGNHYVDDFVMSFDTVEDAIRVTLQVKDIHATGGFELRNFASNSVEILRAVSDDMDTEADTMLLKNEKILGMRWEPVTDEFFFSLDYLRIPEDILQHRARPTKRQLLSLVMSIFDPFGFIADFMLNAKVILQKTWDEALGWDDYLTDELYEDFNAWLTKLLSINELRIQRCHFRRISGAFQLQLHVFVDASETAMAVSAYWLAICDDQREISFIMGKTRCAPKKQQSIPRLELQAAVMGARLCQEILRSHTVSPSYVVLWSDSQTVLKWIRSDSRRYKPYVAHRVAEILTLTEESQWSWVPSEENPADDGTRCNRPMTLSSDRRWLQGPESLRADLLRWSDNQCADDLNEDDLELKCDPALLMVMSPESLNLIEILRFSSFIRLLRSAARVIRFVQNIKSMRINKMRPEATDLKVELGTLTHDEIRTAEIWLCREAQERRYSTERERLKNGLPVERLSSLYQYNPYLDEDGLLRCAGRIDNALIVPFDTRRPILLPPDDYFTVLLVLHHHRRTAHQFFETTMAYIRERFMIPTLRTQLKKSIRKYCMVCRLMRAKAVPQQMGQLPDDRFFVGMPTFVSTGVDLYGPVEVTVGRSHVKRWVVIFVCMTTGAIHVEIADDLSTDAFILCLRNFINIRGQPQIIRSDNGTNFVGYQGEIRNVPDFFDTAAIEEEMATEYNIEWKFNCPKNPEAGGRWERMVQSVKRALRVTLATRYPRDSVLRSFLLEAMNIVNSRPLTQVPLLHDKDIILTPNHLILGKLNSTQTPSEPDQRLMCLRKQWRISQQLKNYFWKQWMAGVLPLLIRRCKWYDQVPPLTIGQLVMICDPDSARNSWRRGRITEVHQGKDGQTRTATVMTSTGELRRPACRLAVLDVIGECSSSTEEGVIDSTASAGDENGAKCF